MKTSFLLSAALLLLGGLSSSKPVKVFILAGQSNLEGQAVVWKKGKEYNDGKGTLGKLMSDRAKAPKHAHLAPDQSGRRNTVITSL